MKKIAKGMTTLTLLGLGASIGVPTVSATTDSDGVFYGGYHSIESTFASDNGMDFVEKERDIHYFNKDYEGPKTAFQSRPYFDKSGIVSSNVYVDNTNLIKAIGPNKLFDLDLYTYNIALGSALITEGYSCTPKTPYDNFEVHQFGNVSAYLPQSNVDFQAVKKEQQKDPTSKFNDVGWKMYGKEGLTKYSLTCSISQSQYDEFKNTNKSLNVAYEADKDYVNPNLTGISEGNSELKNMPFVGYEISVDGQPKYRDLLFAYRVLDNDEDYFKALKEDIKFEQKNKYYFDEFTRIIHPNQPVKQPVKANVLSGGISGGIVSTEVGKNLAIEDVDFGTLKVGQVIPSQDKTNMITVRDWTGGNGWKLTAKHKEADRNQSLQLGVQVDSGSLVDLNDQAQLVTNGESQLDVTQKDGSYTAKWGTHPTVGEFNNIIEWNLTANVTE